MLPAPYTDQDLARMAEIVRSHGLGVAAALGGRDMIATALAQAASTAHVIAGGGEAWRRVYGWSSGRALTPADVNDLQHVLADYLKLLTSRQIEVDRIRAELISEIGGAALVAAIATQNDALRKKLVRESIAEMHERAARHLHAINQ